jgi:hypothetical protein
VATLNRVSATGQLLESIPDVLGFSLNPGGKMFYYRKYVAGAPAPELHLRDLAGNDHNLGPLLGRIQWANIDTLVFIGGGPSGNDSALTRVTGLDGAIEVLRTGVSRFLYTSKLAAVTVTEAGSPRDLILDLADLTKPARPLPIATSCCWISLTATQFTFAEAATAEHAAVLHQMDLVTGVDVPVTLPPGMVDVTRIVASPQNAQALLADSAYHLAVLSAGTAELLPDRAAYPAFSPDGKDLYYVRVDPLPRAGISAAGPLFVRSTSYWTGPAIQISPGDTRLFSSGSFLAGRYVYWASVPNERWSDLHAFDPATGKYELLARSIFHTAYTGSEILVINHAAGSPQTGDLLYRNLATNQERYIDRVGVTNMTKLPGTRRVAYVIRERADDSPRNGLWAATLPD